jgi:hypothetical protein
MKEYKIQQKQPCNNCQGGGCPTCSGYGYFTYDVNINDLTYRGLLELQNYLHNAIIYTNNKLIAIDKSTGYKNF